MAGSYDNTDQIDTQVASNDSVKISGSTLKFGALRFYRGPAVPPNSFGRNGDIILLDDTARPQEALQSNIQPSTVGLYQKIPAAIPTGPVVYDTPLGGGGVQAVLAASVDSGVTPVSILNFIDTTVVGNQR